MASNVDIKALFESGVHFGHKTSHWNPKMAPYIHSKRQEIHIIDLEKTVKGLEAALPFLSRVVANGKQVLFVGTKKHTKDIIKQAAVASKQPYMTERWLGGTLTNVATVTQQIKKLKDLEKRMASGDLEKRYSKLEVQRFQEEIDDLNIKYGGIKELNGKPGALLIIDVIGDANAIKEAKTLGIPVVAIVDTNADPTLIDYVIPGNDDAIKGVQLILDYVSAAIAEGAGLVKAKIETVTDKKTEEVKEK
ncbi:MAG TPA: 30S ribosomal protein S2 [Candidatus Saccharimonadales bacterium]|nr:30S ribosomal protein S2 [Candidatus Saccharimonadales bacterium]